MIDKCSLETAGDFSDGSNYNNLPRNKRKFDDDLNSDMRFLEELFYYTYDEKSRYISHLKEELRREGFIQDEKEYKVFKLKEKFKNSDFYKTAKIWHNYKKENSSRRLHSLQDVPTDYFVQYQISGLNISEEELRLNEDEDIQRLNLEERNLRVIEIPFGRIDRRFVRKAVNILAQSGKTRFQFKNMKKDLAIESVEDLRRDEFLGKKKVRIIGGTSMEFEDLPASNQLGATIKFLEGAFDKLGERIIEWKGGDFRAAEMREFFGDPKTKVVEKNKIKDDISDDNDWYVLERFAGTQEELDLIEFIKNNFGNLSEAYEEAYLLRNEEVYKIYNFADGRGFQPDFILFLRNRQNDNIYYQIFIEPKGAHLIESERWKEEFLLEISRRYGFNPQKILKSENKQYRLIGLPFFTSNNEQARKFENKFDALLSEIAG